MKTTLFYKLIPYKIRMNILKKRVIQSLESDKEIEIDLEKKEVLQFLKENKLNVFPYDFIRKYNSNDVEVFKDEGIGLHYMYLEGKKLYYKSGDDLKKAKIYFNSLLLEQDSDSPHCYLSNDFTFDSGEVLLDIGAAEGNFSLSVIEKAKFIYLFEQNTEWIKALEATFQPWKDKIRIVSKYVSDHNDNLCVKLDDFFRNNETINFIKADVEGAEGEVIRGAENIIRNQKNIKISVCTYHRQEDAEVLNHQLLSMDLITTFSKKYMIFYYGRNNIVKNPFLRRAIIRAIKK